MLCRQMHDATYFLVFLYFFSSIRNIYIFSAFYDITARQSLPLEYSVELLVFTRVAASTYWLLQHRALFALTFSNR